MKKEHKEIKHEFDIMTEKFVMSASKLLSKKYDHETWLVFASEYYASALLLVSEAIQLTANCSKNRELADKVVDTLINSCEGYLKYYLDRSNTSKKATRR